MSQLPEVRYTTPLPIYFLLPQTRNDSQKQEKASSRQEIPPVISKEARAFGTLIIIEEINFKWRASPVHIRSASCLRKDITWSSMSQNSPVSTCKTLQTNSCPWRKARDAGKVHHRAARKRKMLPHARLLVH